MTAGLRSVVDPLGTARDLHAQAVEAYAAARPWPARRLARRALDCLDAAPPGTLREAVRVRLLVTLALSESEVAGPTAGLAVLDEAERHAAELDDPAVTVLVRSQRGGLALRSGDLRAAAQHYAAAHELVEHAPPFDRQVLLGNYAITHLYLGDLRAAQPLFEAAIDIATTESMSRARAMARHNLGYLEFLVGDLPAALRLMDDAVAEEPELPGGVGLLDRARVLVEAGLLSEAESALAGAAALFAADRLPQDLGEVEVERARVALLGGDTTAARRYAGRARDRFRRRGADPWQRAAELVLVEADLAAGRPGARLVEPARRLAEAFAAAGLRAPARSALLIEVEALLSAGRTASAATALGRLPVETALPITARMHAHYVHARVDLAEGRADRSGQRIRRAMAELTDYQAGFGSLDLRTASAVHGRRLADLDISSALDSGRPAAVFAAAERARAASSRMLPVRPPADPEAADLLAELRQVQENLRGAEHDPAASTPLLRRRRDLERRIGARTWTRSGGGTATRPVGVERVRARLADAGQTMVTFVQTSAGRLGAVVLADRLRLVDLGDAGLVTERVQRIRADLDLLAVPRLPPVIATVARGSLGRTVSELDRYLVRPLDLDGAPAVFVTTGILGQVPWAAFPSLRNVPVQVAASASTWYSAAGRRPTGRARVTAIAGPALDRGAEEATEVARRWDGGPAVVGGDATCAAFASAMTGSTVLHVAAHGVHQVENPLFSSVRMVDGPVFVHELDQQACVPEHVVLSACEVGLATVRPGDEALGLASVLLRLGTHSVVAGVARVGDIVAEATMRGYHDRLARGLDSAAALAQALAEVDADVVPPFVHFGAGWSRG